MYFCQRPILQVRVTLMIQGLSTSHSGLRFAQERLRSTAHNIANSTTMETASLSTRGRVLPEGGVVTEVNLEACHHRVEQIVEMIAGSRHFAAGVRAVQVQVGTLVATFDIEG